MLCFLLLTTKIMSFPWPSESEESDFEGGDITSYLPEPSCQLKLQDDSALRCFMKISSI